MSFSFQGPTNRPIIQGAQNMMNNGGGGNLGYFQRGKKKGEENSPELFGNDDEDSFELSSKSENSDDSEENTENSSNGNFIQGFFKKILGSN